LVPLIGQLGDKNGDMFGLHELAAQRFKYMRLQLRPPD
jgi:hypothetical protein